jgi:hypothetical protein
MAVVQAVAAAVDKKQLLCCFFLTYIFIINRLACWNTTLFKDLQGKNSQWFMLCGIH